jgi:mono/diheme cytochrome c family protein
MKFRYLALFAALLVPVLAGADVVYRPDQTPGDDAQVQRGKASFMMCIGCHGMNGEGQIGVGPRINSANYIAIAPNDLLTRTITEGRTGTNMIAWGPILQEKGVADVVAFMRSWQTGPGVTLDESPLKSGTADGSDIYFRICASCHGRNGAGYSELGSGTGIGRAAFLSMASNGFLRQVIKDGKDNTPMRPFAEGAPTAVANLTDEEIDAVIQYLRTSAW